MIHILYPNNRLVSEAQIISWATDLKVDAAARAGRLGRELTDEELEQTRDAILPPTLDEAKELLEDAGKVTFAKKMLTRYE